MSIFILNEDSLSRLKIEGNLVVLFRLSFGIFKLSWCPNDGVSRSLNSIPSSPKYYSISLSTVGIGTISSSDAQP